VPLGTASLELSSQNKAFKRILKRFAAFSWFAIFAVVGGCGEAKAPPSPPPGASGSGESTDSSQPGAQQTQAQASDGKPNGLEQLQKTIQENARARPSPTPAAQSQGTVPTVPAAPTVPIVQLPTRDTVSAPQVSPQVSPQPVASATPSGPCKPTILNGGHTFSKDQPVFSCDGKVKLVFQNDGNLVLYEVEGNKPLWDSRTYNQGATAAVFQNDGNLVVYKDQTALWDAKTGGNPGLVLILQTDFNLVIYRMSAGSIVQALWSTNTAR
jgi:hypothetical protein